MNLFELFVRKHVGVQTNTVGPVRTSGHNEHFRILRIETSYQSNQSINQAIDQRIDQPAKYVRIEFQIHHFPTRSSWEMSMFPGIEMPPLSHRVRFRPRSSMSHIQTCGHRQLMSSARDRSSIMDKRPCHRHILLVGFPVASLVYSLSRRLEKGNSDQMMETYNKKKHKINYQLL